MVNAETKTIEQNRREERQADVQILFPVSMLIRMPGLEMPAEVLNYHYKGACLRFAQVPPGFLEALEKGKVQMDFFVGKRLIRSALPFRMAWQSLTEDQTIGIEFLASTKDFIARSARYSVHPEFAPQVSAPDPLDPNRTVFFKVQNISETGMLVLSSLANKHLLPGLNLRGCTLSIPGHGAIQVSLFVANTRRSDVDGMFELGVSVDGDRGDYIALARRYVSILSPIDDGGGGDLTTEPPLLGKQLKQGISYRLVSSEEDYVKILKLRHAAYSHKGKAKPGAKWGDQGEGLRQEGTLLAGFMGSRLVCCVELRFSDGPVPFRLEKYIGDKPLPMKSTRSVEINKLVVHPKAHGSDVIVGIFQKIHSILVIKGGYDILILATDQLAPLYVRLGFIRTDISVQHPHLANTMLTLLQLPMNSYLHAKQINPVAWMSVYESTQRFLEGVGVAQPLGLRYSYRLKKRVGTALTPLLLRTKGKKKASAQARSNDTSNSAFVDPRWTSQHIIAPIIKPYIAEADEMIGKDKVDAILNQIGVPRSFFNRQANWVSIPFLDEFLDRFSAHGSISELSRRSGERSLQRDQIGVKYLFLKHFATPRLALQSTESILKKFNLARSYKLLEVTSNRAKFAVGTVPGVPLPKHKESCLNWQANFEAYFKIIKGTVGRVKKLGCCYEGDEACLYELEWTQSRRVLPTFVTAVAFVALTLISAPYFTGSLSGPIPQLMLLTGAVGFAFWELFHRRQDNTNFATEYERIELESSEKYSELQLAKTTLDERYREARLLEETAKAIQASSELSTMLQVSLDSICTHFGFDRAFVMLVDEKKEMLRTSALACIQEGAEDLWGFRVDLSKQREKAIFVSSVFHTGNSVLIDNIDTHIFQLNEVSQSLIRKLGSKGFIIVPIPSENGRWGVLIADKTTPKKSLSRTDLTLLQRVSQHLGIALDKQAKLEHERGVRQLFQKYVPVEIINQVQPGRTAALGGQLRKVYALFLDIRDFTRISSSLPPQATLDWLNRVFNLVQETASAHGGWIDKFLGDGALITWGAVGTSTASVSEVILAAIEIQAGLTSLNEKLVAEGFPHVKIGMGINCGQAIVGNVGAATRMEYTSIGGPLNVASRLESLSKELGAFLVVSDKMLAEMSGDLRKKFKELEGVTIRGVQEPVRIGFILREGTKS